MSTGWKWVPLALAVYYVVLAMARVYDGREWLTALAAASLSIGCFLAELQIEDLRRQLRESDLRRYFRESSARRERP